MVEWFRNLLGRNRDQSTPHLGEEYAGEFRGTHRSQHTVPRSADVNLDRAVDLVVKKHGDTLRELADR